jgi:hypothetical protein
VDTLATFKRTRSCSAPVSLVLPCESVSDDGGEGGSQQGVPAPSALMPWAAAESRWLRRQHQRGKRADAVPVAGDGLMALGRLAARLVRVLADAEAVRRRALGRARRGVERRR